MEKYLQLLLQDQPHIPILPNEEVELDLVHILAFLGQNEQLQTNLLHQPKKQLDQREQRAHLEVFQID
jgi:hypothetical protein